MKPYEKIKQLRLLLNKTTYDLSDDIGISQSTISKIENNNRKLEPDILKLLSNYFCVSYDFLLNNSEIDTCPICSFNYCPLEKEDFEEHKIIHTNFLNFPDKELFLTYKDREIAKRKAHDILDNPTSSIHEKVTAAEKLYQCWFSRSLETRDFNINHPLFNEYAAMMLNRKDSKGNLSEPVYNILVKKYGLKKGMPDGESYAPLKKIKLNSTKNETTLLENYKNSNDEGKKMISSYSDYVSKNYKDTTDEISATKDNLIELNSQADESIPVAAHANKNATEEDNQHDMDIMNDDSQW